MSFTEVTSAMGWSGVYAHCPCCSEECETPHFAPCVAKEHRTEKWRCPVCGVESEGRVADPKWEPRKASHLDRHTRDRAVGIFERRMGFEFTHEYEQSREWTDAMAEATGSTDPYADCACGHGRHTHVRYYGACGLCDCIAVREPSDPS